ncbi:MAG TPA: response regulator [Gemmatimonadales bacterium]|nr:response regulator [Gemmatimonadales bacterium]
MSPRILVVDDEPSLRRTLERALTNFDYQVVAVADPHSAYLALDESRFDLVLLDLRLPQMAGDTFFLAIIRRWPRLLGRVILMSGDPASAHLDWPAELVACPILSKPFTLDSLAQLVGQVLTQAETRSDLREGNGHG